MFNSRKTIAVKTHELEGLHQRLEALGENYSATSTRLAQTTMPSTEHNNLKRELKEINEQMTEIAQCHNNLIEEIFQLRLGELSDDIQQVIKRLITLGNCIALQTIEKAYRDVCQRGEIPETVQDLLLNLAEMAGPDEEDKNKPLWLFVKTLRKNPSLNSHQKTTLEQLLQERNLLNEMENSDQAKEYYLMIKVADIPAHKTYDIAAKLVIDPVPLNHQLIPPPIPIDVPPATNPNGYTKNELPRIVEELIKECGATYNIPISELTVQLFLQKEFISLPIEHEQFQIAGHPSFIGYECQGVIVRSYDRHFPPLSIDYKAKLPEWKKNWQRYLKKRQLFCKDTLYLPSKRKAEKGVGVKFVESDKPQEREQMWERILAEGIPIALWVRQPADPKNDHPIMQAIIDQCPLAELPNRLRDHRYQHLSPEVDVDEATRIKNSPLCLLLDNPFRPFSYSHLNSNAKIETQSQ